jgi:hypothetical protein
MNTLINTPSQEAHISDFGLVAALVTTGFGIRRTERDGRRVFFVFENSTDLQDTTDAYWSGTLKVYARQLIDNTKMLKSLIYAG